MKEVQHCATKVKKKVSRIFHDYFFRLSTRHMEPNPTILSLTQRMTRHWYYPKGSIYQSPMWSTRLKLPSSSWMTTFNINQPNEQQMEILTAILLFILALCLMLYALMVHARGKEIRTARRVLLVTSHPDDETMFFGPTILSMTKNPSVSLFLLCMSNGDYRREGQIRKKELYSACQLLGIEEPNITILSYTKLRDDPSLRWRDEIVSEVVLHTIESQDIDTVLTFDRHGISGHKNHCALYTSLAFLCLEDRIPRTCRVFALKTVNLVLKYSSFLDVPMSFLLTPSAAYVASPKGWLTLRKAMRAHKSQYVWFRKLYMLFSRYVLINTYFCLLFLLFGSPSKVFNLWSKASF